MAETHHTFLHTGESQFQYKYIRQGKDLVNFSQLDSGLRRNGRRNKTWWISPTLQDFIHPDENSQTTVLMK
jgi:hypothetical protein